MSESLYGKFKADARVTPYIGYCPYCPNHEGVPAHQRLTDLTREARQCPRCQRVYIVADPVEELEAARRDPAPPDRLDGEEVRATLREWARQIDRALLDRDWTAIALILEDIRTNAPDELAAARRPADPLAEPDQEPQP